MTKNFTKIVLIFAMISVLSGCGELAKKFIRKNQPKKEGYSFYQVEEYKAKPAPVRYQNHFILWHNWHSELERSEDVSYSKDILSADESMKHLTAMRDMLTDEEAKKIDIQIKDLQFVINDMKKRHECVKDSVRNRRIVERVDRVVQDEFSFGRMRKYIKAED